jgi:hypothetical protein
MDEMPKQLLAETREPMPCQAGQAAKEDYEYKRNGVADLFMVFEPLQGKRYVAVTEKRRRIKWATVMKQVADVFYPQAGKIVVVLDNLNTHTPRLSMKPLNQKKPDDWWNALSFTLRPSMAVG